MHKQYFISDPHFGHYNIITFKDDEGNLTRPFKSIEEMDELIIENCNKLVRPCDKLYILGDCAMNRRCLPTLDRCDIMCYYAPNQSDPSPVSLLLRK